MDRGQNRDKSRDPAIDKEHHFVNHLKFQKPSGPRLPRCLSLPNSGTTLACVSLARRNTSPQSPASSGPGTLFSHVLSYTMTLNVTPRLLIFCIVSSYNAMRDKWNSNEGKVHLSAKTATVISHEMTE